MQIQKNDIIECTVDTLGIYGEGIAHVEGRTVFIRGALPDERVRAKIVFERPTFCDGKLLAVLHASPDRAVPVCPVFGKCGGCALQHMSYAAECDYKRKRLEDTFAKVARLDVQALPTVQSARRERYRNKLSLPVRATRDGTVIGFFAQNTHRVVPIDDCPLQPEWVKTVIATTHRVLEKTGLSGYDEQTNSGDVRHITVRAVGGALYIAVVTHHAIGKQKQAFVDAFTAAFGESVRLYGNRNERDSNVIYGTTWEKWYGSEEPVTVDGFKMDVHPASFFQVNDDVREKLYAAVIDVVGEHRNVIDAYAGAGLMTAKLAQRAAHVIGIELDPAAAAAARKTAAYNRIANMEPREGDCARLLPAALNELPDACVVLDPPQKGCDARVLDAVCAAKTATVVYVSCNPATLARDVARLGRAGFTVESTQAFDMFPMTASMESLTVLRR